MKLEGLTIVAFIVLLLLIGLLMLLSKAHKKMKEYIGNGATNRLLYPLIELLVVGIVIVVLFLILAFSFST